MKTNKSYFLLTVLLILTSSIIINGCGDSKDPIKSLMVINSSHDSTRSIMQRYGLFSQDMGQTTEDIKYIYSKNDDFSDCDTLETTLIKNNYLIKIIDDQGLLMTTNITKYWSTDGLFDGYVDWSKPIWNEENPNIIKSQRSGKNLFEQNEYEYHTLRYLAGELGVFAGWNPVIPANFISQRDTTSASEEGRNIIHFKTVKPLSDFCSKDVLEPLAFWAEAGTVKDLKDLKQVKYIKKY